MTVSSLVTSGWLCDPETASPRIIIVGQTILGVLPSSDALAGVLSIAETLSGSLSTDPVLSGTVSAETLSGVLSAGETLVGRILCEGEEIVANISLTRGDSRNLAIEIDDDLGADVDLSEAILRFAVKRRTSDSNSEALLFKTSYDDTEIEITVPLEGKAVVRVRVDDTVSIDPGVYCWDLDVSRKDSGTPALTAGTFDATTGSSVLQYSGTPAQLAAIRVGSIIELSGVNPENAIRVVVTAIDSDALTVTTGGYAGYVTEAGISHQTFDGDRKTPVGLSGSFEVVADVVR